MRQKKSSKKDSSWIWWLVIIALFFFLSKNCNGNAQSSYYPFDPSAQDDADTAAEIREAKQELDKVESDPCSQDIMNGVPPEYRRCGNSQTAYNYDEYDTYIEPSNEENSYGCPYGCNYHKAGCDIKGNISMDGEKIYHVPGGEFYNVTTINSEYGEKWFCSQEEAASNGWRKSYK